MPEKKPKIFIGSSSEGVRIAQAVAVNLHHDAWSFEWPTAFGLSTDTIDALISKFRECEFAVFIFAPDDRIEIRNNEYSIARDNVIFEAGLFMGMHGRDKCFIVVPDGTPDYHLPSDFYGFTPATYHPDFEKQHNVSALSVASSLIRIAIKAAGGHRLPITCETKATFYEKAGITYPLKLLIYLTNTTSGLLLFKDLEFRPNKSLPMIEDFDETISIVKSNPKISLVSVQELRLPQVVVEPSKRALIWVPLQPDLKEELYRLVAARQAGNLSLNVVHINNGRVENISLAF